MNKSFVNQPKVGENESSRSAATNSESALTTRAAKDSERMADSESTKSPAFQFYPADFVGDSNVAGMSLQERGAYITLICYCWIDGTLPDDTLRLSRLCGVPVGTFRKLWPSILPCFRRGVDPHRLIHPRLERERQKQAEYRRIQSLKGKASGAARNRKGTGDEPETNRGSTGGEPDTQPNANRNPTLHLQSSSSSSDFSQSKRAGAFCEWYADAHERLFGIGYMGTNLDYQKALELCGKFTDQQLRDAALVWFGDEDDFATRGTRTVPKFASRITGYLQTIKAKGLAS